MNGVNKQFINVIGVVLVVAVLVAGVALIALPMWSQAQSTDASTQNVAQTNAMYQAQIDQLSAAENRIDEIDSHIAALRMEITSFTKLDDVFELIVEAVEKHELILDSVKATDAEPFAPRVGTPTETVAPVESTSTDVGEDVAEPTAAEPASDAVAGQLQVAITIELVVPDAATAMAFVDDLRVGPRLLLPIDVTLSESDNTLTVTLLTFIRTEG